MKFTKMHGIGNDYVYVDAFKEHLADPAATAVQISDRHKGIGSDGLILICPSDKADVRMRMFNADGSESEMCGNGIRCVAKYTFDHDLSRSNPLKVETGRGVLSLQLHTQNNKVDQVTVDMGEPVLELADIPTVPSILAKTAKPHEYGLGGIDTYGTPVSVGNPHITFFLPLSQILAALPLESIGPRVEHHPAFPKRINAHWAQILSPTEITMRTWERGSGITQACGTGACATLVAAVLTGRSQRKALIHLPGGDLTIEWREQDNHVHMTGPATEVFSGEIQL